MLCPINYKFPGAIKVVVGKVLLLCVPIASQASTQSKQHWEDGTPSLPCGTGFHGKEQQQAASLGEKEVTCKSQAGEGRKEGRRKHFFN